MLSVLGRAVIKKIFKNHWVSGTVMIPNQNLEIYASVTLFVIAKIVRAAVLKYRALMYDKNKELSSIPEKNESEDEVVKWVPKKKHEVLKAKYKCLKKLFQIYDASVIGILPENYPETYEEPARSHRRKRSHRTKTDACAGTTETSSGDVSISATEKSAATALIKDLNLQQCSTMQISKTSITKANEKYDKSTQESKEDVATDSIKSDRESECVQISDPHPIPYFVLNERRRPTRFQSFINRILGIKPERKYNCSPTGHVYALSDNNFLNRYDKRKRRGLRFRRRRTRKVHSEIALRDVKSPLILSYVQSAQKSCLMDTTPRQCPILGCRMIFYGIINYNDHLNLCHFSDRKFVCHYCHEGFSNEYDKIVHENEHIGISKIAADLLTSPSTARKSGKIASNTQTDPELSKCDVPEEKLKKIVSFFDKIADSGEVIQQMKKNRYSESNLQSLQQSSESETTDIEESKSSDSEKRLLSSADVQKNGRNSISSADSDRTSTFSCGHHVTCRFCGENFDFRRQLSLHVDIEHRAHDKFSKFNSCPGIISHPVKTCRKVRKTAEISSEDGRINVQSLGPILSQSTYTEVSRMKSVEALNCDPSANIVYYTSVESITKKPSVVGSFVNKIRSYKWEPGTKIIRV